MDRTNALLNFFRNISQAYRMTFGDAKAEGHKLYVLEDLAQFCHANTPTFNDREAGRRDVWLRIQDHLHLSPEQLMGLNERKLARRLENTNA